MHGVSSYIISGALVTLFLNKTEVFLDIFIMIKIKQRYLFWTINHEINDITTRKRLRRLSYKSPLDAHFIYFTLFLIDQIFWFFLKIIFIFLYFLVGQ